MSGEPPPLASGSAFASRFGKGHFGLNRDNVSSDPTKNVNSQIWAQNTFFPRRFNDVQRLVNSTVGGTKDDYWNLAQETNCPLVHGPEASPNPSWRRERRPYLLMSLRERISIPNLIHRWVVCMRTVRRQQHGHGRMILRILMLFLFL